LEPQDSAVLWLDAQELDALAALPAPRATVYVSTLLAGDPAARVPAAWRAHTRVLYPYELPGRRIHNMATFESWLALRNVPRVDEAMQSEVYFAFGYLAFTLGEMLDNLYRDCLVDRGEANVRRRELLRAEEELMIRQGGHPPPKVTAAKSTYAPGAIFGTQADSPLAQSKTPLAGAREGTTIYPRLSLAPGQRLASKGAYVLALDPSNGRLIEEGARWFAP
jgi:hypothetical protein